MSVHFVLVLFHLKTTFKSIEAQKSSKKENASCQNKILNFPHNKHVPQVTTKSYSFMQIIKVVQKLGYTNTLKYILTDFWLAGCCQSDHLFILLYKNPCSYYVFKHRIPSNKCALLGLTPI